ncbi:MAG: choice-of-anchor Q domain-containing protein [Chloroflexota bacterium]
MSDFSKSVRLIIPIGVSLFFIYSMFNLAIEPVRAAGTIYVDADASGGSDGSSWADAYTDLQAALSATTAGSEIWVARGVYTPGNTISDTFQLLDDVALYGGFVGTETLRTERDWETNVTVLSGDIGGDDTTNADGVVITTTNQVGDNSYQVVTGSGVTTTAVLDGFFITAGQADSLSSPTSTGAGIYSNAGSPTLSNLYISGNYADSGGGGMYFTNSDLTANNLFIHGNSSDFWGGGIYISGSNLTLRNTSILGNSSVTDGGGALVWSSDVSLANLLITGNQSRERGGGILFISSNVTATNLSVVGNATPAFGGGIGNLFGDLTLANSIIDNNRSLGASNTITASIFNLGGNLVTFNSLIANSGGSANWNSDLGVDGGNNLDLDPLFIATVDPLTAPTTSGNLQLQLASPAINAGITLSYTSSINTDIAGNERIQNGIIDMGAYERGINCPDSGVVYVDQTAAGSDDGSTWTHALRDLQEGLLLATLCSPDVTEIWVAEGIYTPGDTVSDTFQLLDGVAVYGGFDGTETARSQRDWNANATVLSGDIGEDDVVDGRGVVMTTTNQVGDNSLTVVNSSAVTSTAILDGFFITAGQKDDNASGGGMINDDGSPSLSNLVIVGNYAERGGGGMYSIDGDPSFSNIIFQYNYAGNGGGGAQFRSGDPSFNSVTFSNNAASSGGGLFAQRGSQTLTDVTFLNNRADGAGGGMYINDSDTILTHITFTANLADFGGGLFNTEAGIPILTDVTFEQNEADYGGGMYTSSNVVDDRMRSFLSDVVTPTLTSVTFISNTATEQGGGLYATDGKVALSSVTFEQNSADDGGGFYNGTNSDAVLSSVTFSGNTASDDGGGVYYSNAGSSPLTNVLFSNNSAVNNGGGGYVTGGSILISSSQISSNSSGNEGGGFYINDSQVELTHAEIISNNTGTEVGFERGGGFSVRGNSSVTLTNATVSHNRADGNGGGIFSDQSRLILSDTTLSENSAGSSGGGISHNAGDGVYQTVTFSENSAGRHGGGLDVTDLISLTLTGVDFIENSAADDGGGIYFYETTNQDAYALYNVTFKGNRADDGGGFATNDLFDGVFEGSNLLLSGNQATRGGAIFNRNFSRITIINATVSGNRADGLGGGIYNINDSRVDLINSVVWYNEAISQTGTLTATLYSADVNTSLSLISSSLIEGSGGSAGWDPAYGVDGGGNLDADPLFFSAADPLNAPSMAGDLRLQLNSPAIDAGNTLSYTSPITTDLAGNERIINSIIDMGAYETKIVTLTVAFAGVGTGSVSGLTADCTTACSEAYAVGSVITLSATADPPYTFGGWDGACSSFGSAPCVLTLSESKQVSATFTSNQYLLTTSLAGSGSGSVVSDPAGINCGSDCSELFDSGTSVTLTPTPDVGSTFVGWGGSCSGSDGCSVSISDAAPVTATFELIKYPLTTVTAGDGSGTVSRSPDAISYTYGTTVTLTAVPASGSSFDGWSGGCAGTTPVCSVTMDMAQTVTATFALQAADEMPPLDLNEPPNGAEIESPAFTFEWGDLFDAEVEVDRYLVIVTQTITGGSPITFAFSTADTRLNPVAAMSQGSYTWSVTALDAQGQVIARSTAFTFELEIDISVVFMPVASVPEGLPDLVVDSLSVSGENEVSIVIRNAGDGPVRSEFWVDLYVDLLDVNQPPFQEDDVWQFYSHFGAAWGITEDGLPLAAGETLTLTNASPYYDQGFSNLNTVIEAGTALYVQVDSANANTGLVTGGVYETHEAEDEPYNNIYGPVFRNE